MTKRGVAIMSGGIDSFITAALLKERVDELYGLTFKLKKNCDLMQIECAQFQAKHLGLTQHKVIDLSSLKAIRRPFGDTHPREAFPLRNLVFLSIAAAYIHNLRGRIIGLGSHADDIRDFPDCDPLFLESLLKSLNLGARARKPFQIFSPSLLGLRKHELILEGTRRSLPLKMTWSCYRRKNPPHCGVCESCKKRRKAFRDAGIVDPTEYLK